MRRLLIGDWRLGILGALAILTSVFAWGQDPDEFLDVNVNGVFATVTVTTFTADDTTPSVAAGNVFRVPGTWTAGHNITMFDGGATGQTILVIGGDSDCVVVNGGNLKLESNWTGATGFCLPLVFDGTNWDESGARGARTITSTWTMSSPPAIGGTAAAAGKFTTLEATGKLTTVLSAAVAGAGFILPPGTAPNSPVNGDVWVTSGGIYVRVNGATVGPLIGTAGVPWTAPGTIGSATPNTGKFTTLEGTGSTGNTVIIETTGLVYDATNNRVGLGTAAPQRVLHVYDPTITTPGVQDWVARFGQRYAGATAGGSIGVLFDFNHDNTTTHKSAGIAGVDEDTLYSRKAGLGFFVSEQDADVVEKMRLGSNGNLTLYGDEIIQGGDLTLGVSGTTRGAVYTTRGTSTNTPGVWRTETRTAGTYYLWVADDGGLREHTSAPAADTDGYPVRVKDDATFTADDTTPDVSTSDTWIVPSSWTAGHNITGLDGGYDGQLVTIVGGDSDCVIVDSNPLYMSGNWTATPLCSLTLRRETGIWIEVARSAN